jgi:hypothetical protein
MIELALEHVLTVTGIGTNLISVCPGLVDSVHYVMHLLMPSPFSLTSGASPTDIELVLSPKFHVSFSTQLPIFLKLP